MAKGDKEVAKDLYAVFAEKKSYAPDPKPEKKGKKMKHGKK